ncbi:hypothetical protein EIP91_004789 [Steccherinum ochraceum]|uniref:F-box domain-containing protein n=1 Tax=Steccherinum ochraceum TaxID=92696 RepID=A0A4R0R865_9APHY|nr:hypothetical protein EIP91_004789 [Steccherinum ochraceum]
MSTKHRDTELVSFNSPKDAAEVDFRSVPGPASRSSLSHDMDSKGHTVFAPLSRRSRQWLDEEETKIRRQLYHVRSEMNVATPIGHLPAELISEVLIHLRESAIWDPQWISITHVCRQWRDIALNTRKLWSTVSFWREDLLSAYVARAGDDTPLSLEWDADINTPTPSKQIPRPHFSSLGTVSDRSKTVKIVADFVDMRRFEQVIWQYPWTSLESLDLDLVLPAHMSEDLRRYLPRFPITLFWMNGAPKFLQHLRLTNVIPHLSCDTAPHRALKTLEMRYSPVLDRGEASHPPMEGILDLLSGFSASLESLVLIRAPEKRWASDPAVDPQPTKVVSLDRLKRLHIADDSPLDVAYALSYLLVPDTTVIELGTFGNWAIVPDFCDSALWCLPRSSSLLPLLRTIRAVELDYDEPFPDDVGEEFPANLNVYAWKIKPTDSGPTIRHSADLNIRKLVKDPYITMNSIFNTVLHSGHLFSSTTSLRLTMLSDFFWWPLQDWEAVLLAFPSLDTIVLRDDWVDSFSVTQKCSITLMELLLALFQALSGQLSRHSSEPAANHSTPFSVDLWLASYPLDFFVLKFRESASLQECLRIFPTLSTGKSSLQVSLNGSSLDGMLQLGQASSDGLFDVFELMA